VNADVYWERKLRSGGIEERLRRLDAHGLFDYFHIWYGAYQMKEWGRDI
jgi:hypothetical protein